MSAGELYCVNHPKTPTLLRCNRCGRPVCLRCVERTPVGYRCRDCLNLQQAGYYTAVPTDYLLAAFVGFLLGGAAGVLVRMMGGLWLLAFFAGPIAGGLIAEAVRLATRKRRGRYLWVAACLAMFGGAVLGALGLQLGVLWNDVGPAALRALAVLIPRAVLNVGFLIFIALALSTLYARLKA